MGSDHETPRSHRPGRVVGAVAGHERRPRVMPGRRWGRLKGEAAVGSLTRAATHQAARRPPPWSRAGPGDRRPESPRADHSKTLRQLPRPHEKPRSQSLRRRIIKKTNKKIRQSEASITRRFAINSNRNKKSKKSTPTKTTSYQSQTLLFMP